MSQRSCRCVTASTPGRLCRRHCCRRRARRRHRRADVPLRPARLVFRAGHARLRRSAAHRRQRRADHRRGRRHADQARSARRRRCNSRAARSFYWVILALVAVSLVIARLIERSRFGVWLIAVRENEDAAKALGVDATHVKLAAMVISGGDHRGGRLFLRAIFSVHRCRHRLRHLDLGRGAADADHRRRRHGVRAAARRAGRQVAG